MRGRSSRVLTVVCVVAVIAGCASRRGGDDARRLETAPAPAAPAQAPPAGSPLAKVQIGMGMNEIRDLIGGPTDTHTSVTGKAFIPYYQGDDQARVQWHYKGQGRVIFSAGGGWGQRTGVARVEYDPSETGYYRAN